MSNQDLINAIKNNNDSLALSLIQEQPDLAKAIDKKGNTPLIIACELKKNEIADELIESGLYEYNITQINNKGNNALMTACISGLEDIAYTLSLHNDEYNPSQINKNGNTALMIACINKFQDVALNILTTGQSLPEQVNKNGNTALTIACKNELENVALKLIETGQSNPEHITNDGNTALMIICKVHEEDNYLKNVALKLIETGQSNPGQINKNGNTALILACKNNLTEVAMKLIETGLALIDHDNNDGKNATFYATLNNMRSVVNLILLKRQQTNKSISTYDISKMGYDMVNQENIIIQDFLKKSENNLCLIFNKQAFLTNKDIIAKILGNDENIKYGCKRAGNTTEYILDENVNYVTEYLNMSMLIPMQIFVKVEDMTKILLNNLSNKIFELVSNGLKLPAIISKAFLNGSRGIGADHCQPGKETEVYTFVSVVPICECETNETTKSSESNESTESNVEPIINIMYKGVTYKINVNETMNIGDLKQSLITKLLSENVINSNNQNVRFVYLGKVYTDNSMVLSQLPNFSYGITLQAMMNQIGGKKRKTKKYKRGKGKQCHRYTRRK